MLVSLPVTVRVMLPACSRVLPQLHALAAYTGDLTLTAADQIKIDITMITQRIKTLDHQIPAVLNDLGCSLTDICGVGVVTAMELHAEIGDPWRFQTEARFARWCGSAPVALSSGEGHGPARHHRLDLGGNRNVNSILHIEAYSGAFFVDSHRRGG